MRIEDFFRDNNERTPRPGASRRVVFEIGGQSVTENLESSNLEATGLHEETRHRIAQCRCGITLPEISQVVSICRGGCRSPLCVNCSNLRCSVFKCSLVICSACAFRFRGKIYCPRHGRIRVGVFLLLVVTALGASAWLSSLLLSLFR